MAVFQLPEIALFVGGVIGEPRIRIRFIVDKSPYDGVVGDVEFLFSRC